jgi:hypothetical protein
LNYASIMGIKTDAHLVGQEVSLSHGHLSSLLANNRACSTPGWEPSSISVSLRASILRIFCCRSSPLRRCSPSMSSFGGLLWLAQRHRLALDRSWQFDSCWVSSRAVSSQL